MKYVVQASNVTELYEVKKFTGYNCNKFYKKPAFVKKRIDDWKDILFFECDKIEHNSTHNIFEIGSFKINISEFEEVAITSQIFRADKSTTYLHSDKVLSIKEDKTTNWQAYQDALIEFRDYVFEKFPKVKEYCELHCVKDELENIDKVMDIVFKNKKSCERYEISCDEDIDKINSTLKSIGVHNYNLFTDGTITFKMSE